MNQQGRFALTAGLAALLVAGGCGAPGAGAAEVRNVSERVFPLDPSGNVTIQSQNGRIVIEAWDRPQVRVQITRVVRADDEARANELMRKLVADVEAGPNQIKIRSQYPKRQEQVGIWAILLKRIEALNINYYLQVPKNASLDLRTTNGEIRIRGTSGAVTAETVNGGMELAGAGGPANVRTTNGDVKLTGVGGSATARTTNGGVTAEVVSIASDGVVDLGSTNGDVAVQLPKNVRATVDAVTTNGRVSFDFPISAQGRLTSKSIRGTIAGGGARVSLHTTNGNIDLTPGSPDRAR